MLKSIAFSILFLFGLTVVNGHGDLHERIVKTTKEIEINPDSAYLYFKRGQLYFHHENYDTALIDLKTAEVKGFESSFHQLFCAKTYYALGDYDSTLSSIDKILIQDKNYVKAIKLKAHLLYDLGKFKASALAYEELINKSVRAFPDDYILASNAWFTQKDTFSVKKAIAILDKGVQDLGPIISILSHKKKLYTECGDIIKALDVSNEIIAMSNRKERLYFQAFELAYENQNFQLAKIYLENAEESFSSLPDRIKINSSMIELNKKIRASKIKIQNEKI